MSLLGEADLVTYHLKNLLEAGVLPKDIAVISPYNLQVSMVTSATMFFLNCITSVGVGVCIRMKYGEIFMVKVNSKILTSSFCLGQLPKTMLFVVVLLR